MKTCQKCQSAFGVTTTGLCTPCALETPPAPQLAPFGVLLHYYGQPDDHKAFRETQQSKDRLVRVLGLLEHIPPDVMDARQRAYRLTARGQAYVDSLLRVPLPEAVWVTTWPTK